ncbi:hypothetical protein [Rhodopseudomonas palustris]|uniref:hypothetical protein n=1 Tax=Rhodopseudomonas palustris TaxID=1076 RepID=UPI0016032D06|nr:hypothetical protein [Rhodopseudomonas palustris]
MAVRTVQRITGKATRRNSRWQVGCSPAALHAVTLQKFLAHAKRRYEEIDEPQESIAADLRIHRKSVDRLAKSDGWKLRKDRPPRELSPPLQLSVQASEAPAAQGCNSARLPPHCLLQRRRHKPI